MDWKIDKKGVGCAAMMTAPILILLFLAYVPLPMNIVVTYYTYGDKEVLRVDNNNNRNTYFYLLEDGKRSAPLKIAATRHNDWYWSGKIIFRDSVYFVPDTEVFCDTTTDFRLFELKQEAENYETIDEDTTAGRQIDVCIYHNDSPYAESRNKALKSAVMECCGGGYREWPFGRQKRYTIDWAKVNAKEDTVTTKEFYN